MPDGPKDDDFIPGFPLTGFDIRTYGEDRLLLTVEVAPDETSFAKANRLEIPFGLDARQARGAKNTQDGVEALLVLLELLAQLRDEGRRGELTDVVAEGLLELLSRLRDDRELGPTDIEHGR